SALAESGVLSSGSPHPRAFGTFPRLLGKYVREEQRMPLEDAIRKITSLPAEMLRLTDRGLLKENYHADITIFDPATVTDNATFQHSQQYPSGIPFVLVNGIPVIDGDKFGGKLPGKVVRS
ncbi:MAG: amidohydrolase family protein, partial [Leptospiraceae bacterium]|nr:amidohydrolase family protein [Leptospiraceae bacterium]